MRTRPESTMNRENNANKNVSYAWCMKWFLWKKTPRAQWILAIFSWYVVRERALAIYLLFVSNPSSVWVIGDIHWNQDKCALQTLAMSFIVNLIQCIYLVFIEFSCVIGIYYISIRMKNAGPFPSAILIQIAPSKKDEHAPLGSHGKYYASPVRPVFGRW